MAYFITFTDQLGWVKEGSIVRTIMQSLELASGIGIWQALFCVCGHFNHIGDMVVSYIFFTTTS